MARGTHDSPLRSTYPRPLHRRGRRVSGLPTFSRTTVRRLRLTVPRLVSTRLSARLFWPLLLARLAAAMLLTACGDEDTPSEANPFSTPGISGTLTATPAASPRT